MNIPYALYFDNQFYKYMGGAYIAASEGSNGSATMPFVSLKISGPELTPAQKRALQTGFTELMAGPMRKVHDLTAVAIERVEGSDWTTGARPSTTGRSAYAEVKVTQGTNSSEEMQRFIAEGHALLTATLGTLPEATYVVVHEIPAQAWGYAGRTQEARRQLKQAS
jgi:4-oxalocrotonate tautomerase